MDKLTDFKEFVKTKPNLIKYVKSGDMSWQKFYELYDLYGSENEVWNDYVVKEEVKEVAATAAGVGLGDMMGWLKNMDLNSMQNGISSVQRVIGLLQDFGGKNSTTDTTPEYKPRPLYKHFED